MIHTLLSRIGVEIWKDIPEFEGDYQASNLGNVKSIKFNRTKILNKWLTNNKRYTVNLWKNKKPYYGNRIAVLVAKAFLNHKPSGHKLVVDHIDNDKTNDCLYNLQVISHRENISKDMKNKVGYTGVSKCTSGAKFYAQININKKCYYLGSYKTPKEASQAYQNELKKLL